jgi:hypothetical protein
VRDGVAAGSASAGSGAGVRSNAAVNTLRDCRIVGNAASDTRSGVGEGGSSNRRIVVERCEILGNTAVDDGGGIGTHGSGADMVLDVIDGVIAGNTAGGEGGGIFRSATDGTTRVIQTLIEGNQALEAASFNGLGRRESGKQPASHGAGVWQLAGIPIEYRPSAE